jgi:hypothetical protein
MSFSKQVKGFSDRTKAKINKVTRASIIDLGGSIIRGTPVGNPDLWKGTAPKGYVGGAARGNWFSTLHTKSGSEDEMRRAGEAVANLVSVAARAPGNVFYLTNNLPYIGRLEYEHWSVQAPTGMVRVNTDRFQSIVKQNLDSV